MRSLSERETRLIRIAAVGLAMYLIGFFGLQGWRWLEARRGEYASLREKASELDLEILRERVKARRLEKLKASRRLNLHALEEETVVGEASVAIQKAAQTHGVKLGSSRESAGRTAGKELAVLEIEGTGVALAVTQFLHDLGFLGYPLAVDWVHLQTEATQPGQVRVSLRVVVLNPAFWQAAAEATEENGNA